MQSLNQGFGPLYFGWPDYSRCHVPNVEYIYTACRGLHARAKYTGILFESNDHKSCWTAAGIGQLTHPREISPYDRTVNGSVNARLGKAAWPGELKFSSVNGGVNLELPAGLNADVHFKTLNGNVDSDFPITMEGSLGGHVGGHGTNLTGRIGSGGRQLDIETVNGRIELKRAGKL